MKTKKKKTSTTAILRRAKRATVEALLQDNITRAQVALRADWGCTPTAFKKLSQAARDIGGARARLTDATVGQALVKNRKKKYWGVVQRLDNQLTAKQSAFTARCLRG